MGLKSNKGWRDLKEHWRSDLIAAISVALVALPLALGIAVSAGAPPISGLIASIIGGLVTTFFRGSHISINGPTAGLIVVILGAIAALDDGSDRVLNYVFAAILVAGAIQVAMGLLKLGRLANMFHSTVIQGILAAIGVIIFSRQIHVAMGSSEESENVFVNLVHVFTRLPELNPFVTLISVIGLLVLIFHSKIRLKIFQLLPAPMWVLILSIPLVYAFNFFEPHTIDLAGKGFEVGPHLLISIPDHILDAIMFPDFSRIDSFAFWSSSFLIAAIASIESLASAKAVDKLDPLRRKTDLNKDLIGVGIGTMLCGAIGGLPIINVIVRSTVNIHNEAKTKWSNFFHGALLLVFVFLLSPYIQQIPHAALAIILVFIGYKLASPKVFKKFYNQGWQQLVFFVGTLLITLQYGLMYGIIGGLALVLLLQMVFSGLSLVSFYRGMIFSGTELIKDNAGQYKLKVRGVANFLSNMKLASLLEELPQGSKVQIDLAEARLVDYSVLEDFHEFQRFHSDTGGEVEVSGLTPENSSSNYEQALKVITSSEEDLTAREVQLKEYTYTKDWHFLTHPKPDYNHFFEDFHFFQSRSIVDRLNSIFNKDESVHWEISDVQVEDNDYRSSEEHITTMGLIRFPFEIPRFRINKKRHIGRFLQFWKHQNDHFETMHDFSQDFSIRANDKPATEEFIDEDIKSLINESSIVDHLESNGKSILIFIEDLKLAHVKDYDEIVDFTLKLKELVMSKRMSAAG